jgi:hypothetical protein
LLKYKLVDGLLYDDQLKKVISKKEVPYKVEPKQEVVTLKKPNHFPDCNCNKCERWKQQNAK